MEAKMSATDPKAQAIPPPTGKGAEAEKPTTVRHNESSGGGRGGGLWGWLNHLNWRSGGDISAEATQATTQADNAEEQVADAKKGKAQGEDETATTVESKGGTTAAPAPRPMNIWLRRALERQAESAIAEAIRDGKPIPTVSTSTATTAVVDGEASEPVKGTAETKETTGTAAPKVSFADLMRQHREGLLAPAAQPPVKATKVVKKPKAAAATITTEPMTATLATATTPTAKKNKAKSAEGAAVENSNKVNDKGVKEAEGEGEKAAAGAAVHQGVVRKRAKASSVSNSASARRTQDTNAAASATATPTHAITVKGKASLEELRARRNRTTSSTFSTPTPLARGANGAESNDAYNDSALDAISQLLLRYCLGDQPSSSSSMTTVESAREDSAAHDAEKPSTTATTNELAFFNQLMELCETNSLTAESLELLRKLFEHVRVLPRPVASTATTAAAAAASSSEQAEEESAKKKGTVVAAEPEMGADAYREASRRREYVQQVIMVLINRLKQLKLNEQQRQQMQGEHAAKAVPTPSVSNSGVATSTYAGAPQPVIGHAMPSIKVGGVSLNPLPTTTVGTTTTTTTAALHVQKQQQPPAPPNALSYNEQMRHLAAWHAMTEIANGSRGEDEAAAFAAMMAANGYPNPYAHLTVFSQHQPVAPPVGWLASATRSSSGSSEVRRGHGGEQSAPHNSSEMSNLNVAARLMPSPFPGAFPIIPPPPSAGLGGSGASIDAKDDRETQELFRMIRCQLTQPVQSHSHGAQVSTSPSTVAVLQAEREVLRHVQEDFKKQQQQHNARATTGNAATSPAPPTASTPPTNSLDAAETQPDGSNSIVFACQGKQREEKDESQAAAAVAVAGEKGAPSKPSLTAPSATATTTTLNLHARPFVPGQSTTTTTTVAAESTPTKTTFNYKAAPFLPSGKDKTNAVATPVAPRTTIRHDAKPFIPSTNTSNEAAPHSHMNVNAREFEPLQQQQRQPSSASSPQAAPQYSSSRSNNNSNFLSPEVYNATPASAPATAVSPADPWVSYEMFARWRDMMEAYYQGVFAAQQAAPGASSSSLTTPPRQTW